MSSIFAILMKLMSKHLWLHLVLPLIVGLTVEMIINLIRSLYNGQQFHPLEYLISWERFGAYAGILAAYLLIAGLLVNNEAKPPWRKVVPDMLDQSLKDATSFFATCTIPLKGWFDPYTQQYFSHIVKHQLDGRELRHERVLLFFKNRDLENAKTQFLDGSYAKALAMIHQNYGIKLGYLEPADVNRILAHNLSCEHDFAFVTHQDSRETVLLFKKKGHVLKLRKLREKNKIAPYKKLVNDLKMSVSEPGTPVGELQLDVDHDFFKAVFPG